MTALDDELTVLLALDALEPDEQADAELRLETFPLGAGDVGATLAERTTSAPPGELRAATLACALSRRRAGRPTDRPAACSPTEAFDATIADFAELLASLGPADWDLPAHRAHGRVRDVVAHLVGIERLAARWLDPHDDVAPVLDHVAATRPVIEELRDTPTDVLAAEWHRRARAVAHAARALDLGDEITFHDLQVTIGGFLIARTFELWAHAIDVAGAAGRPLPQLDAPRMLAMSGLLMSAVPLALAYRGSTRPGRTMRFVLTGPAGGCYDVALHPGEWPDRPHATIITDVVDLCRLAARRLTPSDLSAEIEGDSRLADVVLAGLDAFARD